MNILNPSWAKLVLVGALAMTLLSGSACAADEKVEACHGVAALDSPPVPRTIAEKKAAALAAATSYLDFFQSARGDLKERDYLIELAELALLAKEHLLMVGPPGNAKSMLAERLLRYVVTAEGKPSYYRIQMTPETTLSETHGPLDYKKLQEHNVQVRQYKEGMLLTRNVFIDEIFDAAFNAMRNTLMALNERVHAQGPRQKQGRIETAIAATNKYLNEVYERAGNNDPQAVIDRFAFVAYVPGELELVASRRAIIQRSKIAGAAPHELRFEELDRVRALVSEVEIPDAVADFMIALANRVKIDTEQLESAELRKYQEKVRNNDEASQPYRSTKYHSTRTEGKAAGILKAMIVSDWIKSGGKRELRATIQDVAKLEKFFGLNGPSDAFLQSMLGRANPKERTQIETVMQEREIFRRHYNQILADMNKVVYGYDLRRIQGELDSNLTQSEKATLAAEIQAHLSDVTGKLDAEGRSENLNGEQVGLQFVKSYLEQCLQALPKETAKRPPTEAALRREVTPPTEHAVVAEPPRGTEEREAVASTAPPAPVVAASPTKFKMKTYASLIPLTELSKLSPALQMKALAVLSQMGAEFHQPWTPELGKLSFTEASPNGDIVCGETHFRANYQNIIKFYQLSSGPEEDILRRLQIIL